MIINEECVFLVCEVFLTLLWRKDYILGKVWWVVVGVTHGSVSLGCLRTWGSAFSTLPIVYSVSTWGCLENKDPRKRRPKTEDLENKDPP